MVLSAEWQRVPAETQMTCCLPVHTSEGSLPWNCPGPEKAITALDESLILQDRGSAPWHRTPRSTVVEPGVSGEVDVSVVDVRGRCVGDRFRIEAAEGRAKVTGQV